MPAVLTSARASSFRASVDVTEASTNKQPSLLNCSPDTWMTMYQEAEKLAGEVLKVDPGDETAQALEMIVFCLSSCQSP